MYRDFLSSSKHIPDLVERDYLPLEQLIEPGVLGMCMTVSDDHRLTVDCGSDGPVDGLQRSELHLLGQFGSMFVLPVLSY